LEKRLMNDLLYDSLTSPVLAGPDWRQELAVRGWSRGSLPDRAVLAKPALIRNIADVTIDAGSSFLLTNTESANAITLQREIDAGRINADDLSEINRQAASICRQAVSDAGGLPRLVVGVMGPSEQLITLDEVKPDALESAYAAQAEALTVGGAEAIACRHFTELAALLCAVRAGKVTGRPVIACLTFDSGVEMAETALGVTIPHACEALIEAGVDAIGCDDGENADAMPSLISAIRSLTKLPIWAGIAAGGPQWIDGEIVYPEKPQEFAARLVPIVRAGANILAMGAGASLDHLAAFAKTRRQRK
jgi:5-methyltetrahydrofolate--homocysteine methyltransferase